MSEDEESREEEKRAELRDKIEMDMAYENQEEVENRIDERMAEIKENEEQEKIDNADPDARYKAEQDAVMEAAEQDAVMEAAEQDAERKYEAEQDAVMEAAEQDAERKYEAEQDAAMEAAEDNGPSSHTTNDRWAETDKLGYWVYVDAIYNFLIHPETKAPLTISVQAPWGGGKTSIMRMIQGKLDYTEYKRTLDEIHGNVNDAKKSESLINQVSKMLLGKFTKTLKEISPAQIDFKIKEGDHLTVWFNAWKYDSTKQVWAGLADAIIRQITNRLEQDQREKFWILVNKERINAKQISDDINQKIFSRWVNGIKKWFWIPIAAIGAIFPTNFIFEPGFSAGLMPQGVEVISASTSDSIIESLIVGLGSLYVAVLSRGKSQREVKNEPASATLNKFIEIPDYGKDAGYVHRVDEDLRRILKIIQERYKKPIIIFIDDLDRCTPTKVADVIEAVNRFLSAEFPGCFFVMGMDAELVAAALEEHHSSVLAKLPKHAKHIPLGWRFMDKFVQLPVVIPPPEKIDRDYYVENLISSELKEKVKDYESKAHKAREKAYEHSKNYRDDNEEIKKSIKDDLGDFSDNPREIKRFINLYRFYYFLSTLRKERQKDHPNLKIPEPDQMTNWIKLTLKWPAALRWILRSSGETGFKTEVDGITTRTVKNRLEALEKLAKLGTKEWQTKLRKLLQLNKDEYVSWIEDEDLREHILKSELSKADGVGFF